MKINSASSDKKSEKDANKEQLELSDGALVVSDKTPEEFSDGETTLKLFLRSNNLWNLLFFFLISLVVFVEKPPHSASAK